MQVVYLHGFASSPKSTKAGFLASHLRARGVDLVCPDFNLPDFRTLTMTRMLAQLTEVVRALPPEAVTLIGSSLGGTLAVLASSPLADRVERLVLLAPAVMFARPGHHLLAPERLEQWRHDATTSFVHYADGVERLLDFTFYEDSLRHDAFESIVPQPTLIFQGLRDASVDHRSVEAFASTRSNVTLSLLDDDHQLGASLSRIWVDVEAFLGLTGQ